jgi:lipopolysaccharide export system protein LptC
VGIRVTALVVLILIVTAFSWWMEDLAKQLERAPQESEADIPDFFMDDYQINVTDDTGQVEYQGSGDRMDHWQKSGKVTLESPVFVVYQQKGPPSILRSERAEGKPDGDEVHLLGEVILDREAFNNNDSIHAVTRDMTLWPGTQRGHTDARVEAIGKKYKVEGKGMTIDLLAGTLELHSKVRGVYED